jgi:glycosyltransferase involved in cell wall biosynthesis
LNNLAKLLNFVPLIEHQLNKLVSIITPSFNKADFIVQTVNSVIAQNYTYWEMIIVDDCSTDHSQHLLGNITTIDARISVILNERNKGGNACRNQGLANAKGEYIIFLDADDLLDRHCLQNRVENALTKPDADLWVFPMAVFRQKVGDMSQSENWIPPQTDAPFLSLFLKHQLPWQTMQPLWSKDFLNRIQGFDESFVRLQDVELHTRALIQGAKVVTFPSLTKDCNFRIDENRFGNKVFKMLKGFTFGAIQYYNKFYTLLQNTSQQKILTGSLLEPLTNVCFQRKANKISKSEYQELANELIKTCKYKNHAQLLKSYAFIYSLSPTHPKGLKKIISFMAGLNH